MKLSKLFVTMILSVGMTLPQMALAEYDLALGNPASANARLNFRITIPEFVFFRVGSLGAVIDTVDFDLTTLPVGATPGDGTPLDATATTDNVAVTVITNDPAGVILTVAAVDLTGSGIPTIPVTSITSTNTGASIPPPQFGGPSTVAATGAQNDVWTFDFDNAAIYPADTYTTTATYTASSAP